jgi:hypothetical protein
VSFFLDYYLNLDKLAKRHLHLQLLLLHHLNPLILTHQFMSEEEDSEMVHLAEDLEMVHMDHMDLMDLD